MPDRPPADCPMCGAALPPSATPTECAGCGFPYDAATRIWRSSDTAAGLGVRYAVVGGLVGLAVALVYPPLVRADHYATVPLLGALIAAAAGLAVRRLVWGRISGRFAAITPRGLVFATRGRPMRVAWENLDGLEQRRGVVRVRVRGQAATVPLADVFSNPLEQQEFCAAARAAAADRIAASKPAGRGDAARDSE